MWQSRDGCSRFRERMVSVVWWKWGALSQKLDDFLEFLQILASFPHAIDIGENCLVWETFFISPNP